ncbi:efflux transporter outer membrane subunit [Novosphingobium rosa]|uniref:efflux transporter outer membrane subunit n=1 Tax=Novosphingobium rosa TaxID=76978 RepID=UPI00083247E6|nr:TolC family protein [Novosphingobium rosa]
MPYPSFRRLICATLSASLLAGCVSAPKAPPASTLALPDRLTDQPLAEDRQPVSAWWRLYRDPALDALVEEALANNRDLRAAAAHWQEARALLGKARAGQLPGATLSAGVGGGSTLQDQITAAWQGGDTIRTGPRYDLGGDVSWELDLTGRLRAQVRAARADARTSAALLDGVRIAVAADVTGAWLRVCGFAHQAAVARDLLRQAKQVRDLVESLRAAGAGVPADVMRADATADAVEASIPALEAARHDALAELAVLSGHMPGDGPVAVATCTQVPGLAETPPIGDGYGLLRRRPDVRAAESRLAASTARIGVAVGDLYPHIALSAQQAVSSPTPGGLRARGNMVWRIGPLLDWSFPDIGVARARIRQARAGEAAALAAYDGAILNAFKEVNQAARDYGAVLERQAALTRAVERSAQADDLMRRQRAAGGATALEALAALRARSEASAALAAADLDVAAAQVRLFKALGGGWEQAPPITQPHPSRTISTAK